MTESGVAADRGAEVLNRLRRRDPHAALREHEGRWRKAGPSSASPMSASSSPAEETIPELRPHAPVRLRGDTPAASLFRRQDADGARRSDAADPPAGGGLNLDIDLDDLGLDDLELPDDLKLDPRAPDAIADEARDPDPSPSAAGRTIRTVRDLKGIRAILPFGDYDPNPDPDDPCRNLCPRPGGCLPLAGQGGAGQDGVGRDGKSAALCPEVTPLSTAFHVPRRAVPVQYRWAAPNVVYNPLYFQDVSLERYGHHRGVWQPAASVAKFGVQLVGLPYQMALDPPGKCQTPLGYYRPGDCAPKLKYQIPLNARAALVQAAAVSGVALILP